jgi:hypothetical protein
VFTNPRRILQKRVQTFQICLKIENLQESSQNHLEIIYQYLIFNLIISPFLLLRHIRKQSQARVGWGPLEEYVDSRSSTAESGNGEVWAGEEGGSVG